MQITTFVPAYGPVTGAAHALYVIGGTPVLTLDGERKADGLASGDRIISRDSGMTVLRSHCMGAMSVAPIHIKAGALGPNRPETDVTVLPESCILLRDWRATELTGLSAALVPAERLVDGKNIVQGAEAEVTVYELGFERPHVIYVAGLEVGPLAGAPGTTED
ncbi:MAG: hypothetical protein GC146_05495 [Limimaricola sp.]|uniref:Hint domain-containing protein n=1 Tax=Limimaricola sp. TaxID=2211665 RepID=UPI001D8EBB88|nr:Hint domain-containing protein [Limimaricola sp.]MBI1416662.1 hypothetical protein [Limimaricola sp.]